LDKVGFASDLCIYKFCVVTKFRYMQEPPKDFNFAKILANVILTTCVITKYIYFMGNLQETKFGCITKNQAVGSSETTRETNESTF
jgi:hypothetical protein